MMSKEMAEMAEENDETSTDDVQRIKGKVAGLLTKRELVINRGYADGVEIGMRFAILNRQGIDVKDPDTGEVLGSVELVKTMVKVVRIDGDHLCIARTFRTIAGTPGLGTFRSNTLASLIGTPPRIETLQIDANSTLRAQIDPNDSLIRVGDPAVEALRDEYDDDD
jgi:hypothetical protein